MLHHKITIVRIYEPPTIKEGLWMLVDRLWPRGIKKESIALDFWLKEIAPSTTLRQWFNHEPAKWQEFRQRYIQELKDNEQLVEFILDKAKHSPLTLFYGAKDTHHNQALVLQDFLTSWPTIPK